MKLTFFAEQGWFFCIVISTLCYGLLNFVYKLAATRDCKSSTVLNRSAITVTLLSVSVLIATKSPFENLQTLIFFCILNSTFFAIGVLTKLKALKHIPSSYAFPISKMNIIILILMSVIILGERPHLIQWLGILAALSMIFMIALDVKKEKKSGGKDIATASWGIAFAFASALATSISIFVGKLASTEVQILNYIFISYLLVAIYTFIIARVTKSTPAPHEGLLSCSTLYGVIVGTLNFIGYFLVLSAFSVGPLSLIQGISATSMIIPVMLSVFFLHEKFTLRRALILVIAFIAVLLIKLG